MNVERKCRERGAQEHKTSGHVQGTTNIPHAWRTNGYDVILVSFWAQNYEKAGELPNDSPAFSGSCCYLVLVQAFCHCTTYRWM